MANFKKLTEEKNELSFQWYYLNVKWRVQLLPLNLKALVPTTLFLVSFCIKQAKNIDMYMGQLMLSTTGSCDLVGISFSYFLL